MELVEKIVMWKWETKADDKEDLSKYAKQVHGVQDVIRTGGNGVILVVEKEKWAECRVLLNVLLTLRGHDMDFWTC